MKKFCVFLSVVLCLAAIRLDIYYLSDFDCFPKDAVYTFYVPVKIEMIENSEIIPNANSTLVNCSIADAKNVRKHFNKISGESLSFKPSNIKLAAEIVLAELNAVVAERQELDGSIIIYAYSAFFDNAVTLDGKRVNLQIAVSKSTLIIGTPLILGSY